MQRWLIVLFCLSLSGFAQVWAETITVSGDVSGVWSADTVLVVGDLHLPAGDSLIVEPGVQVRFTGLFKFTVEGRLEAVGTAADSIIFTRHYPTEESKWRGFRFDGAEDASILEYCRIEWAKGEGAYPDVRGGAIWTENCSPSVHHCLIAHSYTHNSNYNGAGGGICLNSSSFSIIEYNRITQNQADSGGGILVGPDCNPAIHDNLIEDNTAFYAGGGIYVSANGESSIYGNIIRNNTASGWGGGGINLWSASWLYGSFSYVYDNLLVNNSASDAGGGIYSRYDASIIYNNTIVDNTANRGGGIYVLTFYDLPPTVLNAIIRGNSAPTGAQIYLDPAAGSTANVSYSNIECGWTGTGIIDEDPLFVNTTWDDYHLQWGSSCIDAGNPDPTYNDPDGTVADLGCYYYDQSVPVRILLTPHGTPMEIPPEGGSFDFTIQATNIDPVSHNVIVWCDATLPDGSVVGPVLGPVQVTLASGVTLSRERTQNVPPGAPTGAYAYNAYALAGADTSMDSFLFVKLGSDGGDGRIGWFNWGDSFCEPTAENGLTIPHEITLLGNYPNPFNPITTIAYSLPQAARIKLDIYDSSGRWIAGPVNGWREAGLHELTFDGSDLVSGVYIYRLWVENREISGKMILLK